MEVFKYPEREQWVSLCRRPTMDRAQLGETVSNIMNEVRTGGDAALLQYTRRFDAPELLSLLVTKQELDVAAKQVSPKLQQAIKQAAGNIRRFHESQYESVKRIETSPGVVCWRKSVPINKVGLYIPGGSAPLFSTLLMLGIPAQIAGCPHVVVCTPPQADGSIAPEILYTAHLLGITKILKAGGAQAIAALTFGTESVPAVNKIFGPGNQYVTEAKMQAQQHGVAIDMPAGPSEVLVVADESCEPAFVAADLLAQAEHGPDSQVMLVTDNEQVIDAVLQELEQQLAVLPRKEVTAQALTHSKAICVKNLEEALALSNTYSPEHLILATNRAAELAELVTEAGSVFVGYYSCESAGDYASGTNHTLPTNGYAASYSGVSLDSFVKKITFQELRAEGVAGIGKTVTTMAEAEQLQAHANAMYLRMEKLGYV